MKTDRGKVLRRKVEKNAERQVKRTWNCIEGTEWEEEEHWYGSLCWCEKGQCVFAKEERVSQGGYIQYLASGGFQTVRTCWGKKSFNRCSGCAVWLEVGGQFIVLWLFSWIRGAHQSKELALLKFSSLHPVLKHGSRSLAVWKVFWCQTNNA